MQITLLFHNYPKIANTKDPGQILVWLKKYGHNVTLVTNETSENSSLTDFDGVKVIKSVSLINYVIKNAKNIDCLILYHLTFNSGIISLFYRIFSKSGLIILKLDSDGRVWERSVPLFFRIYKFLIGETKIIPYIVSKTVNLIIIESPDAKMRILERYHFFNGKLTVLPNGVNADELTLLSKTLTDVKKSKKILFVGQIIYRKGIDLLVKAFSRLKDDYTDWLIELVGPFNEPGYKKELDGLITTSGLTGRVIFLENLKGAQLVRKYVESMIFCFPSRYESFGLVLIEAMYLGLPVIASDIGCSSYILDNGKCGLIVAPENVDELTTALKKLIESVDLREELSIKAKERCDKMFRWGDIVLKLLDMINLKLYV
ncbi:MAG: glycosyltransferase family 4 protein [Elusimicrobiota bacterium]